MTSDKNHPPEMRDQANAGAHPSSAKHPVGETGSAYAFGDLKGQAGDAQPAKLDFILDIPLEITVELGRTRMLIHDLLKLGQGSVIELGKPAGDTLEILANNRLIAKGDVVVVNDKYGIRLTEVISTVERLEKLK
jgi:flagellar motor switch protein FliN/FliY